MADLSKQNRDRGLAFAKKLQLLVTSAPAPDLFSEAKVNALVREFQVHYGYTEEYKKAAICRHLEEYGDASIRELADEFRWHRDTITYLLGQLETCGRVEFYTVAAVGRGGPRPRRIRLKVSGNGYKSEGK